MANVKISALPSLTAVLDTTLVPVVESATTQQVTGLKIKNYVFNGTGTTLPSTVVASSLTTVGTLTSLVVSGTVTAAAAASTSTSTAASVGYIGMPQNSQSTGYTLAFSDAGKHVYVTATSTVTIPANSSVAFPIGTSIAIIAAAGATVTIAITSDTMYLGGTGTTGSRTLAAYGMATAVKVTATTWFINGTGLT
jgi:hypothetical protein